MDAMTWHIMRGNEEEGILHLSDRHFFSRNLKKNCLVFFLLFCFWHHQKKRTRSNEKINADLRSLRWNWSSKLPGAVSLTQSFCVRFYIMLTHGLHRSGWSCWQTKNWLSLTAHGKVTPRMISLVGKVISLSIVAIRKTVRM